VVLVTIAVVAIVAIAGGIAFDRLQRNAWDEVMRSGWPVRVRFSPDHQIVATASRDDGVSLWDVSSKRLLAGLAKSGVETLPIGDAIVPTWSEQAQIVFAPDGQTFAWTNRNSILFYDLRVGRLTYAPLMVSDAPLSYSGRWLCSVAISPIRGFGSVNIVATGGKAIQLWDLGMAGHSPSVVADFTGEAGVCSLAFSQDGTLLAGAVSDYTVRVWKIPSLLEQSKKGKFQATEIFSTTLAQHQLWPAAALGISPDNNVVAVVGATQEITQQPMSSRSGEITLWDLQNGSMLSHFSVSPEGIPNTADGFAFSPDSKLLAVAYSPGGYARSIRHGTIEVRQVSDGKKIWTSGAQTPFAVDVQFASDMKSITAGFSDGTVQTFTLP
jgi:WD40 repeat protein